jgi:phosphate transport system permease protein
MSKDTQGFNSLLHLRRKLSSYVFVGLAVVATAIAIIALLLIMRSLLVNGLGGINAHLFTMSQPAPGMRAVCSMPSSARW